MRWSRSRTLAARDVFVASLILALADGKSYTQIERELNTSRPTVARWKARFEKDGMAGLETQHQGSKPRTVTPAVQARVLRKTTQPPVDGSTHWSCRKLAATLGLRQVDGAADLESGNRRAEKAAPARTLHGER